MMCGCFKASKQLRRGDINSMLLHHGHFWTHTAGTLTLKDLTEDFDIRLISVKTYPICQL